MKKTKLSKLSLLTVVLMLSITLLSNFATINVRAIGNEDGEDIVIIHDDNNQNQQTGGEAANNTETNQATGDELIFTIQPEVAKPSLAEIPAQPVPAEAPTISGRSKMVQVVPAKPAPAEIPTQPVPAAEVPEIVQRLGATGMEKSVTITPKTQPNVEERPTVNEQPTSGTQNKIAEEAQPTSHNNEPVQEVVQPEPTNKVEPTQKPKVEEVEKVEKEEKEIPVSRYTNTQLTLEEVYSHSSPAYKGKNISQADVYPQYGGGVDTSKDTTAIEDEIFRLLNEQRKEKGLNELKRADLGSAEWAQAMVTTGLFEHAYLKGSKYGTRGISDLYNYGGENIVITKVASNLSDEKIAAKIASMWNNSPGHLGNRTEKTVDFYDIVVIKSKEGYYWAVERTARTYGYYNELISRNN